MTTVTVSRESPAALAAKTVLVPGRNCQEILDIDNAGIVIDGRDYYLSFYLAARKAERHILICGWQFNTGVKLLRGEDAEKYGESPSFLSFLNALCSENPELQIYILAWDYNLFFVLEREWFQERTVMGCKNGQLHFRFDSSHAVAASHHQKFVIIDNKVAFVGGTDICSDRWDTQCHLPAETRRKNDDGRPYGPYHEIQSYVTGPAINYLIDLFQLRWTNAGGGAIEVVKSQPEAPYATPGKMYVIEDAIAIRSKKVAVSRTIPRTLMPVQEPVEEIRNLYLDAISSAEKLIYIENQYFSSDAIFQALADKMTSSRSPVDIIIVLPKQPNAFFEEISVGAAQSRILRDLKKTAASAGHSLGVFYAAPIGTDGTRSPVYIHSKVLIVDDRFMSIGSANFTNRSLRIDTELNLSWEAALPEDEDLIRSIRRIRVALLVEHAGLSGFRAVRRLSSLTGVAGYLNSLADSETSRLCRHPMKTEREGNPLLKLIPTFAIDPKKPLVEENIYQLLGRNHMSRFAKSMTLLFAWFQKYKP